MSIYDSLNPEQLRACKHTYGPLLILAGAGSGKTRVLTHRIAYLINECDVRPYQILAITFTNKAAREMKERVEKTVGEESENIWVSTFHSTCVRILRRFCEYIGYDRNFTIYDADDQKSLIKSIMKQLNIDPKQIKEKAFMKCISQAKDELITPEQYARNAKDYNEKKVAMVYEEYQKRLKSSNAFDFDDLICKTIELFVAQPEVLEYYRNRFRFIMVDEYQDTNTAQFRLISLLAHHENEDGEIERNLCVVGDDDQSIYKFRGANIYNILNFEKEFPDTTVIKLEQNYRSSQNILAVANSVIHHNVERKDKTLWTANPEGSVVHYTCYENDMAEADAVAYKVQELMEERSLDYKDFAVLYRTNAQSLSFEKAMRARGIKAKTIGALSFFQRKEIKDIIAYLKTIDNGYDDIAVQRILNVPKRGIGLTTIDRIADYAHNGGLSFYEALQSIQAIPGAERSRNKVEPFLALIQGFRYEVETNKVSLKDLIKIILDETDYIEYLVDDDPEKADDRKENLEALISYASRYELEAEEASLTGFLEYCGLNSEEAAGEEPEDEEDKDNYVSLMTLHNAKGLEFPYVFLVGMEEGLFPSFMSINSDDPEADVEEERRLCYVGITRAMNELFMSSCEQRMQWGDVRLALPSRFLKEIPRHLLDMSSPANKSYRRKSFMEDEIRDKKATPAFTKGNGDDGYKRHDGGDLSVEPFAMNYKKPAKDMGAGAGALDYAEGDKVSHEKFGEGTVISIVKGGRDFEVTVDFPEFGHKKMLSAFAKLKKI
ncbi:MAG: UvrD-helicase domain-containing protein [Lachnospiraceae bacterium]|nr:UvrD-helicase domain-containing protein [Lachnospiraceae bacterium]